MKAPGDGPLEIRWLGLRRYRETLGLQQVLVAARKEKELPDQLLLMEHYPVVTIGSGGGLDQLKADKERLVELGIEFFIVNRGGGAAYHGPGQLVAYPILDLSQARDLHGYLRRLERAVIASLAEFKLVSTSIRGLTGVWCGSAKIASIGIRVEKWVTGHGLSINISNDLRPFGLINQCGLEGVAATSVKEIAGTAPQTEAAARVFAKRFAGVFGYAETIWARQGTYLARPAADLMKLDVGTVRMSPKGVNHVGQAGVVACNSAGERRIRRAEIGIR